MDRTASNVNLLQFVRLLAIIIYNLTVSLNGLQAGLVGKACSTCTLSVFLLNTVQSTIACRQLSVVQNVEFCGASSSQEGLGSLLCR